MAANPEIIESPLTREGLAARYRALCEDPCLANVPGKIELELFNRAPELCIDVASPSNSIKELREKVQAYLAAGAVEVWIVYPQSKRFEYSGSSGALERSSFAAELSALFD